MTTTEVNYVVVTFVVKLRGLKTRIFLDINNDLGKKTRSILMKN